MLHRSRFAALIAACAACSAGSSTTSPATPSGSDGGAIAVGHGPTLRSDVTPVTDPARAQQGVFIPPFRSCVAPKGNDTGAGPDGKVCTNVAISGCTEPGKYFPDYASCDVVRTQRPYYAAPAAGASKPDDPRLADPKFTTELQWVTTQLRATACTCCHDKTQAPDGPSQWDITAGPIWTDTASDAAIALFAGLADSSIFGAYAAEDNDGFERDTTGVPSTDGARMRAFMVAELTRRGITEEQAAQYPPFGGPLYASLHAKPKACAAGIGVGADGRMEWGGAHVRYVYVLDPSATNPGVPPNLDLPAGTIWRLDVLASADALASGARYGETPAGTFQAFPATGAAPALEAGKTYHLFVFEDVGLVTQNCLFAFGG